MKTIQVQTTLYILTFILSFAFLLAVPQQSQAQTTPVATESSISVDDTIRMQLIAVLQQIIMLITAQNEMPAVPEPDTTTDDVEIETEESDDEEVPESQTVLEMTETLVVNSKSTSDDDEGLFTITFPVSAFGNDLYINRSAERGTALGTAGVNYTLKNGNGEVVSTGTASESLSSSAPIEDGAYQVSEGTSETFTLSVSYDPAVDDFYSLQLHSFNFANSPSNPEQQQIFRPEERFETDKLSI